MTRSLAWSFPRGRSSEHSTLFNTGSVHISDRPGVRKWWLAAWSDPALGGDQLELSLPGRHGRRSMRSRLQVTCLKGQSHEVNISFEGPKIRNSTFWMSAYGFHNFQLSFCEGIPKYSSGDNDICNPFKGQCCGCVTVWFGSGSADPYHWLTDPDPAFILNGWQIANKKSKNFLFFKVFFAYYISFQR